MVMCRHIHHLLGPITPFLRVQLPFIVDNLALRTGLLLDIIKPVFTV
jgi:hypothetical protein